MLERVGESSLIGSWIGQKSGTTSRLCDVAEEAVSSCSAPSMISLFFPV